MNWRHPWFVSAVIGVPVLLGTAPLAIRHMAFFEVRKVELVGVEYYGAEAFLRDLGMAADRNLFQDLGELTARANGLPGISGARIVRRMPATLRIEVLEDPPVAFVSGPAGIVPLNRRALPLPYDPAGVAIDVPITDRPDSLVTQILAILRKADPILFGEIQEAFSDKLGVVVRCADHDIVFNGVPSAAAVASVSAVRRHLRESSQSFERLDVRFDGWIVVTRRNG